jgi:hypothetical protein
MTEAEIQTAVRIIKDGWAERVRARIAGTHAWGDRAPSLQPDFDAIEDRVRRVLPAITDQDLATAIERAGEELAAEADELRQFLEARRFSRG